MEDEGEQFEELIDDGENDQEPMSDEEDDQMDETEAEKEAQYGFELENATMIFDRHKESVFTCRTSPDGKLLASGGQDDCGFVFDTEGNLVMVFFGHKESVTTVAWNCDSSLVASGDLSGLIQVWSMSTKKKIFDCDEGEVEFVMFHPKGKNYLLCGLADGNLYFYNIKDGNFKILAGPNGVACKTGSFLNQGKEFLAVYEDGSLRWFDLASASQISSAQCKFNEAICMALSPDESYCFVGSSDGILAQVILRDQNLKFVTQTKLEDDESHPIESIDFHSSGEMLALASLSGITYVFETSKLGRNNQNVRLKLVHPDGVNGVKFCPGDLPRILTSCLDGKLKIWDCRNGDELITLHGHKDQILDLALEGFSCTTASDDCTVRYWDLRELKEREENQV